MRSIVTLTVTTPSVVRSTPWISLIGGTSSVPLPGQRAHLYAQIRRDSVGRGAAADNMLAILAEKQAHGAQIIILALGRADHDVDRTTLTQALRQQQSYHPCMASMSSVLTVERILAAMRCEETVGE